MRLTGGLGIEAVHGCCGQQGPEAVAAARQKEVFQALARFCSQVSGEAISEDQVKRFRFRDWRRFTQVRPPPFQLGALCSKRCFWQLKASASVSSMQSDREL